MRCHWGSELRLRLRLTSDLYMVLRRRCCCIDASRRFFVDRTIE